MAKKLILFILFSVLLSSQSVLAASTNSTCLDLNISQQNVSLTINSIITDISQNISCRFGCFNATGICNASPYDINAGTIGIMFGVAFLAFIFIYLARHSGFEVVWKNITLNPMQLLFLMVGFVLMLTDIGIFVSVAQSANQGIIGSILNGGYSAIFFSFILTFFGIFGYMLWTIQETIKKYRR